MNYIIKFCMSDYFKWFILTIGLLFIFLSFICYSEIAIAKSKGGNYFFDDWVCLIFITIFGICTIIKFAEYSISEKIPVMIIEKEVPILMKERELSLSQWTKQIKERDKNQCVYCGKTFGATAHHVLPKDIFPELKVNLDNGVTVCKDHHQFAHDLFKRILRLCNITAKQ